VVSCPQPGPVPADDVVLMGRTREYPDSTSTDRDDGVSMPVGSTPTARTLDSTGRAVF
jgi:hypothetical protein